MTDQRGEFGRAVGFLLSQLGAIVSSRFHDVMHSVDLEPRHFVVLNAISSFGGQLQSAIAELLHIPPSSMVSLVDHLERARLVERHPHASDRRARSLVLTEQGRVLLEQAMGLAMGVEQLICEGFSAEERRQLMAFLDRVAANLRATPGVHPGATRGGFWSEEVS